MAVPFYMPDDDNQRENGSSSQTQSTTASTTQTPLPSPIPLNEALLVEAFYEALSLYSADRLQDTSRSATPPSSSPYSSPYSSRYSSRYSAPYSSPYGSSSSPSCCYPHYNCRGDIFFPQTSLSPLSTFDRSESWRTRRQIFIRRRSSTEDDSHNEYQTSNECPSRNQNNTPISSVSVNYDLEEHLSFLAAREHLTEFPGQVPQRKKKKESEGKTESDSPAVIKAKVMDPNYVWPAVLLVVVFAVGCGFLVTR